MRYSARNAASGRSIGVSSWWRWISSAFSIIPCTDSTSRERCGTCGALRPESAEATVVSVWTTKESGSCAGSTFFAAAKVSSASADAWQRVQYSP